MTGGMSEGARINRNLAAAATKFGIPMGVGSQRVMLDVPDPKLQKNINQTFALKDEFPNLFLIGNLGMGQLSGPGGVDAAIKCAEMIDADAMAIHCNSLQEIVQEDGDRDFSQVIENLAKLKQEISIPLLVKEVGTGMDLSSMENLASIGLGASDAIDIGGHGGTSWPWIEALRGNERSKRIGGLLRELGVSTAQSIRNFHHSFSKIHSEHPAPRLIATGGIRSGLDIAKAVFLGASSCGVGLPLFRAALVGPEKVAEELSLLEEELRAVMLACDAKSLPALHAKNKANAKHAQRNVT